MQVAVTFAIAMAPGMGLRFSIPWGLTFGHLPVEIVFTLSLVGELLSVVILTYILDPIVRLARAHFPWLDRLIGVVLTRTRHHHSARFEKLENLFLVLTGISPVPGLGPHTGVLIAYLFGVSKKTSIGLIGLGATLLAIIILALTLGGLELWQAYVR